MDRVYLDNYPVDMCSKSVVLTLAGIAVEFLIIYRLLDKDCVILQAIGSKIPYECAIGLNGYVIVFLFIFIDRYG